MTIQAQTETIERRQLSVWLAIAGLGCAGALAGLIAQYLRQKLGANDAFMALGGSTAIWVTIGFLLARQTASSRPARDRIAWVSVAAAAYLFAWLIAYHTLLGIQYHLDLAQVWPQVRYWLAAVAPACLVLGYVATESLREDLLGDICLALPLGWSLSEIYSSARVSSARIAVVSLPTLLVASLPLLALRRRPKWSLLTVVLTVLAVGVLFHLLFPHLSLDS
jgi:hypothetical protein